MWVARVLFRLSSVGKAVGVPDGIKKAKGIPGSFFWHENQSRIWLVWLLISKGYVRIITVFELRKNYTLQFSPIESAQALHKWCRMRSQKKVKDLTNLSQRIWVRPGSPLVIGLFSHQEPKCLGEFVFSHWNPGRHPGGAWIQLGPTGPAYRPFAQYYHSIMRPFS